MPASSRGPFRETRSKGGEQGLKIRPNGFQRLSRIDYAHPAWFSFRRRQVRGSDAAKESLPFPFEPIQRTTGVRHPLTAYLVRAIEHQRAIRHEIRMDNLP